MDPGHIISNGKALWKLIKKIKVYVLIHNILV